MADPVMYLSCREGAESLPLPAFSSLSKHIKPLFTPPQLLSNLVYKTVFRPSSLFHLLMPLCKWILQGRVYISIPYLIDLDVDFGLWPSKLRMISETTDSSTPKRSYCNLEWALQQVWKFPPFWANQQTGKNNGKSNFFKKGGIFKLLEDTIPS